MRAARATALVGLPLLLVAGCGSIDLPALKPASSAKAMKAGTFTKVVGGVAAETLAEDCSRRGPPIWCSTKERKANLAQR
jgi:hypothetical protein